MTREQLEMGLAVDEPDYYALAAGCTHDDVPALVELAASDDLGTASKAASLAGFLPADEARAVLVAASGHASPVVRVAAAGALQRQPELAAEFAAALLADTDVGVRKWALRSLAATRPGGMRSLVRDHASTESVAALRQAARDLADLLP